MSHIHMINVLGNRYINLNDYIKQMEHAKSSVKRCTKVDPRLYESAKTYEIILNQLYKMKED